jgi:FkbM family methyltransferase
MNSEQIKTKLIGAFGEKPVAFIQAVRFLYLLFRRPTPDPEIALLPVLLEKGDTVVDVGANGANWTYWLHRQVGNTGLVYAFEADPYYARATAIAIRLLRMKGVHLFPFGLSESDEELPLVIADAQGSRLSGLSHIDKNAEKHGRNFQIVRLKRLDSLIGDFPRLAATKLIKCDVEGYELLVFRGAVEILERSRPYIVLETGHYEMQGYSARDVFEFFAERDYASYAMLRDDTLARTDPMMEHPGTLGVNRVMLPREKLMILKDKIRTIE